MIANEKVPIKGGREFILFISVIIRGREFDLFIKAIIHFVVKFIEMASPMASIRVKYILDSLTGCHKVDNVAYNYSYFSY